MLIALSVVLGLVIIGLSAFFGIYFSAKLNKDAVIAEKAQLTVLGADGADIGSNNLNRYVEYENISTDLINAFVALEDKRFFKHSGVDYYRTAGAMLNNLKAGYFKEGGSTITQQLAKNTHLNNEKTIIRKIKEMKLAKDIEKNYSKEQILEMYLNAIYYGNGIYGIDSACKTYFNKSPDELNVSECAILAGIVKSPQVYSPINNPDKAVARMKLVLKLMLEQEYIDKNTYDKAVEYKYDKPESSNYSLYFAAVISEACAKLKLTEKELIKSPYVIYTYFDPKTQNTLNNLYKSKEFDLATQNGSEAYSSATVADNINGGIVAFYSNKKYDVNSFRRQPGSAIKPLVVYAPLINNGTITPADIVCDEKTDFGNYSPSNYHDIYRGKIDVETALKESVNTVAVKLFDGADRNYCIETLKRMGITVDERDKNLALALGGMTNGVTCREMIEAYMTLANGGNRTECGFIKEIRLNNVSIYKKNTDLERVLTEDGAYITTDMLIKTAKDGTAKKLASIPYQIAAKTGTVNGKGGKNSDAWCVSYSTKNTVCVWYGGEDYTEEQTISATGGGLPTLLTKNIYQNLKSPKDYNFKMPNTVAEPEIDLYGLEKDGKLYLATPFTPSEYRKSYCFSVKNCPSEYSPYFAAETQEFFAVCENGVIKLFFDKKYPYSYQIYRENLTTKQREAVYRYTTDISDALYKRNGWTDAVAKGNSYAYTLEIYLNDILVGTVNSGVVIT